MNTESLRIADQLRRAYEGEAWHGPALRELLANVTAEQALAHPLASAHSIWEIALHIDAWAQHALGAVQGKAMPKDFYGTEKDWPAVTETSSGASTPARATPARSGDPGAWRAATNKLFRTGEQLVKAIEGFSDERLKDIVPGRSYDFYHLFHGIVQHSLYHGGQIGILKRSTQSSNAERMSAKKN
jgi:hypothetical protein